MRGRRLWATVMLCLIMGLLALSVGTGLADDGLKLHTNLTGTGQPPATVIAPGTPGTMSGTDSSAAAAKAPAQPADPLSGLKWLLGAVGLVGLTTLGWGLNQSEGAGPQRWLPYIFGKARTLLEDAWDWVRYVGWPYVSYGAKAVGMWTLGFALEVIGGVGFGIPNVVLRWLGHDPDEVPDVYLQNGRRYGAVALATWGICEIVAGLFGEGGGLLLDATGIGAIAGVPVGVASAGLVAAGFGHVGRGFVAFKDSSWAYQRIGGKSLLESPQAKLLTEDEIRELVGPDASEETVQRLQRFQEYAAEKMGNNLARARVAKFLEAKGVGSLIETWAKELPPGKLNELLEMYSGRRALLGAITEQRTALKLAEEGKIILKVNKHTNGGGADITCLDLSEKRLVIVEAKGSFSGRNVAPQLRKIVVNEVQRQEEAITELFQRGILSADDYKVIMSRLTPKDVSIVVSTGGNASISKQALEDIAKTIGVSTERVTWKQLD